MNYPFVPVALRGINPYLLVTLYGIAGFYLAPLLVNGKRKKARAATFGGAAGIAVALPYARKQIACRLQEPGGCP